MGGCGVSGVCCGVLAGGDASCSGGRAWRLCQERSGAPRPCPALTSLPTCTRTRPKQPVEQLTPLDGEERMWDAEGQRNVRWGRLVATVALLAGGGFLIGRSMLLRQPAAALAPAPVAAVAAAPTTAKVAAPTVTLNRSEAAAVIAKWQAAKAAALGPKHDVKGLAAVLRGELLQQWKDRAQQIQKKGW